MPTAPAPPRIVLDTNVCLDLFVFGDAQCARLQAALRGGEVEAVTREDCRAEWLAVLQYPALRLDAERRAAAAAAFDAQVRCLASDPPVLPVPARLPRCADADDQKFLELALAVQAQWLLSRDHEVLRLARRVVREGLFRIATPQAWAAQAGG